MIDAIQYFINKKVDMKNVSSILYIVTEVPKENINISYVFTVKAIIYFYSHFTSTSLIR